MGQPHLPRLRIPGQGRCLVKGHMFVFLCLGSLILFTVHALTDKKVRTSCIFCNHRHRPGIRTVRYLQSPPVRSQHHLWGQQPSLMFNLLAFLQTAPELLRDCPGPCPLHVKPPGTRNGNGIPVTDHIVVYPIGVNHIWAELHVFPVLCQLLELQLKGQLRRNGAQGSDHPL